jgi:hypothetical protein
MSKLQSQSWFHHYIASMWRISIDRHHMCHISGIKDILKWVDFAFFHYASLSSAGEVSYGLNANLIWSVASTLSWPSAPAKFFDFSSVFPYWDIGNRCVCLSEDKHLKYLACLLPWVKGVMVLLKETKMVVGTLNHCVLILPDGSSHLPSLYPFVTVSQRPLLETLTGGGSVYWAEIAHLKAVCFCQGQLVWCLWMPLLPGV